MFGNLKILAAAIAIGTFGLTLPAQAQYSIIGEQPAVGALHVKEASLDAQLTRNYQLGLIDPFELSNMTRDLDAIRVKEESFRMRKQGMTPKAQARIMEKLDTFQDRLNEACGGKSVRVAVGQ